MIGILLGISVSLMLGSATIINGQTYRLLRPLGGRDETAGIRREELLRTIDSYLYAGMLGASYVSFIAWANLSPLYDIPPGHCDTRGFAAQIGAHMLRSLCATLAYLALEGLAVEVLHYCGTAPHGMLGVAWLALCIAATVLACGTSIGATRLFGILPSPCALLGS